MGTGNWSERQNQRDQSGTRGDGVREKRNRYISASKMLAHDS
jgi:hypothetical protein